MTGAPVEPREHCYRCDKPARMCLCDTVPRLDNAVGIHILQHPRERRHPLGTARLLRVGLEAVAVHVLRLQGRSAVSAPVRLPAGAGLLYPSDDAIELESLPPDERPSHLVVIDGTWTQAHRIHRDNPWIQALPHYKLSPTEGSRYRIRAEPRLECLSTVEVVVAALAVIEPELEGGERLLEGLDTMIDGQVAAQASGTGQPRRRKGGKRKAEPVPRSLMDVSRVVVVYGETAPDRAAWVAPREALRLSAVTLAGARVFDAMVTPRTLPDDHLLGLMGLDRESLAAARPQEEVLAAFRTFCSSGPAAPVIVAWAPWTHRLMVDWLPDAEHVLLKAVWANLLHRAAPPLAQGVVAALTATT